MHTAQPMEHEVWGTRYNCFVTLVRVIFKHVAAPVKVQFAKPGSCRLKTPKTVPLGFHQFCDWLALEYTSIACTNMHSPEAALDTFVTTSIAMLGFSTYGLIFLRIAGEILSCVQVKANTRRKQS